MMALYLFVFPGEFVLGAESLEKRKKGIFFLMLLGQAALRTILGIPNISFQ